MDPKEQVLPSALAVTPPHVGGPEVPADQVPLSALAVPPPHIGGATTPWAVAMDPDADAPPLVPTVPPPLVGGHGNPSLPPPLSPMVLWVLPLWGSSTPVGFIYDATPDPDRGLLATALAFFSHQGHQVFHDPCPDLAEYCRAMGVLASAVVSINHLPNHLLLSGLELMLGLRAPSLTNAKFMSTMFKAAYLLPTASGPSLVGGPQVGLSVGGPSVSALAATRGNVTPPVSSQVGLSVGGPHVGLSVGGPPIPLLAAAPVNHGGFPPPHRSSAVFFPGELAPPLVPLIRNPYLSSYCSLYLAPGGICPPPTMAFIGSGVSAAGAGPPPARWPDLNEEVVHSPPSSCSLFLSLVSFWGQSGYRYGGQSRGCILENGYQGGCSSLSSLVGRSGHGLSSPSVGASSLVGRLGHGSYSPSVGASLADDLSVFTSWALVPATSPSPGDASMPFPAASPADTSTPTPVLTDCFTLPAIKTGDNYLQTRDLILFWLCSLGFSTARMDELLLTDARNALAIQYWEGQLWAALKDGPVCFLVKNMGSTFYGKGFEMLQVLVDHCRSSSISNSFTTLLALFNDTQGKKESIHEFWSQFKGHIGALSWSSVAIPPILQVMLFLWGMHLRYQDHLSQFALKHKAHAVATIDSIIADARFMDDLIVVGGKTKPGAPGPSPGSTPSAAAVATDKEGKAFQNPFEWLAT
jgi:hypothetical protein